MRANKLFLLLRKWWLERHLGKPFNREVSLKLDKVILELEGEQTN